MSLYILDSDVLVLGSGLAGLRAAWAALETDPRLNVTVVSQTSGPSGSSFANMNNRLGMQVCMDDREREAFVKDARSIAPPGHIDVGLASLLAEESEARFRDLVDIGFPFDREARGAYFRVTGCFSPEEKRAFIYTGLADAFDKMKGRVLSLGGRFLDGWLLQDLVKTGPDNSSRVCGAVFQRANGNDKMAIIASSVIVALGGPAPLFSLNVCGPGNHGVSYALLKRAGAELVNTPYLQFMWHQIPFRQFWPIQDFLTNGTRIRRWDGKVLPVPEALFELAGKRATHCPVGYDFEDTAADLFFIENLSFSGEVDALVEPDSQITIALMAHAGNGGAIIDENAWTGVPGLYACGESAGGMHGANRIGGAMVTATQVFGARAGKAAARGADGRGAINQKQFSKLAANMIGSQVEDETECRELQHWLRNGMQTFAVFGGRPGLDSFMCECRRKLLVARDWRLRLALEAAILIGDASNVRVLNG
ncbi:Fumarate reductase/succinate dehydrogenase flavoprotein domain protein [Desulfosarcina cetonica]|uniref:FAD-dependent oxidoreductase n=1 Tax=Desulfosarcina cetonica TaxID=90730 RepID=UPI0006CF73DE|nr:FAD-binding protein [Desulfosarcina cetonica]VTR65315.1 Fumarate reductase/succinate dehydrogenase flavoprotein domain protein [Desulfosarcina cetonica]